MMGLKLGITCLCLVLSLSLLVGGEEEEEELKEVVFSSIDDLSFDEEGKLDSYLLLYPERCAPHVRAAIPDEHEMYMFFAVAGDLEQAYFGHIFDSDESNNDCSIVSVQQGLDQKYVTSPMEPYFFDEPFSSSLLPPEHDEEEYQELLHAITAWFQDCLTVQIGFISFHPNPWDVMWIDPNSGDRRIVQGHTQLSGNGSTSNVNIEAMLGDEFILVDRETNEDIFFHTVEFDGFVVIGEAQDVPPPTGLKPLIDEAHQTQWTHGNKVKPSFSPLGFKLGRLPDDVWGSIQAFYYNNQDQVVQEEHDSVYINWWDAHTYMITPPDWLRDYWLERMRPLVEEWVGTELETSMMYGMRQYEKGARLLTHVDIGETHVLSLIINVAQHDVTDPWPVEVYDHAKRLHEVVMEPGDVVYYESAKCYHGRNRPLSNGSYVNLFVHYRPKGDPIWLEKGDFFENESIDGFSEPLLDVGTCRLVGELDQFSQGAVECDNSAIGPHLSPTMFEMHSGDDLEEWWESVGPPWNYDEEEEETEGELEDEESEENDEYYDEAEEEDSGGENSGKDAEIANKEEEAEGEEEETESEPEEEELEENEEYYDEAEEEDLGGENNEKDADEEEDGHGGDL